MLSFYYIFENKMLGYMILGIFLAMILIIGLSLTKGKRKPYDRPQRRGQTMLYRPDSRDLAAEVYYPTYRDSTMVFPRSKREKRKKKETHRSGQD
ncbi:MAG: hypothetical protein RTU30_03895 [Candidatus Thorarchaeota archaeon]